MVDMPPIWRCEKCGFEATFEELEGTVAERVELRGGISYPIYALEVETVEHIWDGPDDWKTVEQLLFRCPRCGHEERYCG